MASLKSLKDGVLRRTHNPARQIRLADLVEAPSTGVKRFRSPGVTYVGISIACPLNSASDLLISSTIFENS